MKKTTISDIAHECGVSLSTVSLVLNNNPRISDKTRKKVLQSVERHGYHPNTQARGLASKSSHCLSVVVPHLNHVFADVYFGKIVSGIYDTASELDYKVVLDIANLKFIRSREYMNILRSRRADGMLFIASTLHDQYLKEFEDANLPFLLVNTYFKGSNLNYICADYLQTARLAADHLLELGHRRVGLIAGTDVQTAIDFREHFTSLFLEQGCAPEDLPWEDGHFREEEGFKAAERLLARRPGLTAIMAGNDKMAIGAMRYLASKGIDVPGQISVMGVDDVPMAAYTTPGLTTIRHPLHQVGRTSCEEILAIFQNGKHTCRRVLPVELILRESTGPASRPPTG